MALASVGALLLAVVLGLLAQVPAKTARRRVARQMQTPPMTAEQWAVVDEFTRPQPSGKRRAA